MLLIIENVNSTNENKYELIVANQPHNLSKLRKTPIAFSLIKVMWFLKYSYFEKINIFKQESITFKSKSCTMIEMGCAMVDKR